MARIYVLRRGLKIPYHLFSKRSWHISICINTYLHKMHRASKVYTCVKLTCAYLDKENNCIILQQRIYLFLTLKTLTRMHIKRLYICLASNLEHRRPQMVCPHQIYIEDMAHVVGEESSLGIQKMMLGLPIIDKYCDQIF